MIESCPRGKPSPSFPDYCNRRHRRKHYEARYERTLSGRGEDSHGGHCIGVDPFYIAHKAEEVNYPPHVRVWDKGGKKACNGCSGALRR
jgi:hypothetical protein